MAQWIPKTAWKISNLNKRYGQQYALLGAAGRDSLSEAESYAASFATTAAHQKSAREKLRKILKSCRRKTGENFFPGSCIIDVREQVEQQQFPLTFYRSSSPYSAASSSFTSDTASYSSLVVSLHPHDLLSGAAAPLLPGNKRESVLFVLADSNGENKFLEQRAINALAALRRWGYHNCFVLDYEVALSLIDELLRSEKH